MPFLIDWGQTPHPALSAPRGTILKDLQAEHLEPQRAQKALALLGLPLSVRRGPIAALTALLETPKGVLQFR